MKNIFKKFAIGLLIGLISVSAVFLLTKFTVLRNLFDSYEAKTYDYRFRFKTREFRLHSIDDVIIVDIDLKSLYRLGNYYRWPHEYHARLIRFIEIREPRAIGFDILFDRERE